MESNEIYLSTGISSLDSLLSPDRDATRHPDGGGILLHTRNKNQLFETPVVLIEGATGVGKTTLAMQIAFSVIRQVTNGCPWRVYLYSLEQSRHALESIAENFGWIEPGHADTGFFDLGDSTEPRRDKKTHYINLCHFSPHPLEEEEDRFVFEQRKSELRHVIQKVCEGRFSGDCEKYHPFFILDSLTAFADQNLSRNELYQLFALFRANHVPVIMTVELYNRFTSDQDTISLESAKFLADIVIELTVDSSNYFKYQLEIIKSKVCRQGLGKHLYKIRTKAYADTISGESTERGIVLYPSIHYVLSTTRKKELLADNDFFISDGRDDSDDLLRIFHQNKIPKGSCISIVGPAGSHKLTLAINIALSHHRNSPASGPMAQVLILNFGNTSDFNFRGFAWTDKNQRYKHLVKKGADSERIKFWHDEYILDDLGGSPDEPVVTVTTFRMGQLTSEECFDVIEKRLTEKAVNGISPYAAVVLTNTAEICTSFPQLAGDPLFLPSLAELFTTQKIVSVCNCVKTEYSTCTEAANLSILSKANYRIYLSHYPTIEHLSKILVSEARHRKEYSGIKEQLISLVVDNVSGKNYVRAPKWLSIDTNTEEGVKTLMCTNEPRFKKGGNTEGGG